MRQNLKSAIKAFLKKGAQAEYLADEAVKPTKETQYVRIVRKLSERNCISPADCLRRPFITTKLSTRIGEIEDKTGIVFDRKRDPETRFMTYSCFTVDDLEALRARFLPEYKPLSNKR